MSYHDELVRACEAVLPHWTSDVEIHELVPLVVEVLARLGPAAAFVLATEAMRAQIADDPTRGAPAEWVEPGAHP